MAWIEYHDTLRDHPKTWALAENLGISNAHVCGLLACLWSWCLTNCEDGDLSRFPVRAIAHAAGWEGEAQGFVAALIDAGYLDDDQRIHDWRDYAGKLIDKRETARKRAKTNYESTRSLRAESAQTTREQSELYVSTVPNHVATEEEEYKAHAREGNDATISEPLPDIDDALSPDDDIPPQPNCFAVFQENIAMLSPRTCDVLTSFLNDGIEDAMIGAVIREAHDNNAKTLKYITTTLQNCLEKGIKTEVAYIAEQKRWREKHGREPPSHPTRNPADDVIW